MRLDNKGSIDVGDIIMIIFVIWLFKGCIKDVINCEPNIIIKQEKDDGFIRE